MPKGSKKKKNTIDFSNGGFSIGKMKKRIKQTQVIINHNISCIKKYFHLWMDRRLATKVLQELVVGRLHGLLLSLRSSSDINTGQ
jgi:hypothetical protein